MDFSIVLLLLSVALSPGPTPVRCQVAVACNSRTAQKRIVIRSPAAGELAKLDACQYRVAPWSGQVCQLLVQFDRLELPQPRVNETTRRLECLDFVQLQRFRLCGRNSGQHLYLPVRGGGQKEEVELLFRLATAVGRQTSAWQLTITQLECPREATTQRPRQPPAGPTVRLILPFLGNFLPRTIFGGTSGLGSGSGPAVQLIQSLRSPSLSDLELLAPLGCDQYFRTATGGIVSFNFAGGVYMPDVRYSICVKGAADSEISYKIEHFELSKANSLESGPGYDTDCRSTVRTAGRVSDYLSVPNSYLVSRPELQATHYCGNGLAGQELIAQPPFVLLFASDSQQTSASETGFQFTYTVRRAQDTLSPAAEL